MRLAVCLRHARKFRLTASQGVPDAQGGPAGARAELPTHGIERIKPGARRPAPGAGSPMGGLGCVRHRLSSLSLQTTYSRSLYDHAGEATAVITMRVLPVLGSSTRSERRPDLGNRDRPLVLAAAAFDVQVEALSGDVVEGSNRAGHGPAKRTELERCRKAGPSPPASSVPDAD